MMLALVLMLAASAGFADGSTWTNPNDYLFGNIFNLPASMMSEVSFGIWYDEIDTVVLAPAELRNYEGYTLFTGYGNYELYETGEFINPFTGIDDPDDIGTFKLGAAGEFFGFRMGALGGFSFTQADGFNLGGVRSEYTKEDAFTEDNDNDGIAEYSWTNSQTYTDTEDTSDFTLGAGVDIGFMGASLYGFVRPTTRTLGGKYAYTLTSNASAEADFADAANMVTAKTVLIGDGEDGKNKWYPEGSSTDWLVGLRGHMPFEIFDISMPIRGDLCFGADNSPSSSYNESLTTSYTTTNVGTADATKTDTLIQTAGYNMNFGVWDPSAAAGILTSPDSLGVGPATQDLSALGTAAAAAGLAYALDTENYKDSNFMTGFDALIDPEIIVADVLSIRTRAQIGYMFGVTSTNDAGKKSLTYNEANDTATASVFTYTSTVTAPETVFSNTLNAELGGLFDLHTRDGKLSVVSGVFYSPYLDIDSTKAENKVTTTTSVWKDETGTDTEANGLVTIGPGDFQGTRTDTETVSYTDGKKGSVTQFTNVFSIPVATKVEMAGGALELVCAYLMNHSTTTTTTTTYSSTTDTTSTVADSAGTAIDLGTTADVNSSTSTTTYVDKSFSAWSGHAEFLLRWNAMEFMTIDFFGGTIVDALDFDILGGTTAGFNPTDFIDSLGISVTISAK